MNDLVYIRPLQKEDALTSYKWRNDPEVWKYTGSKPSIEITRQIESDWICNVLKRRDEKRFAICICNSGKYIGNIQLTNITSDMAQYHIFIGDKSEWGKGYGKSASEAIIQFAIEELRLKKIYLYVRKENESAIRLYKNLGFQYVDNQMRMELVLEGKRFG